MTLLPFPTHPEAAPEPPARPAQMPAAEPAQGIALHCPQGTHPVRDEDLTAGEVVYVEGLGAFPVRDIVPAGPGRRLALLTWGDLALVLHPGTVRACRNRVEI